MKIVDAWTLLYSTLLYPFSLWSLHGPHRKRNNNNCLRDWLWNSVSRNNLEMVEYEAKNRQMVIWNINHHHQVSGHFNEWNREEEGVVDSLDWSWFGWTLNISTDMRFSLSRISIIIFCVRVSNASGKNFEYYIVNRVMWKSVNSIQLLTAEIHKWKSYPIQRTN